MANKAKHAFGSSSLVDAAKEANKIDAFDILFLDGDIQPKVGWIDAKGETRIVDTEKVVVVKEGSLPASGVEGKIYIFGEEGYFWDGTEFKPVSKPTDVSALETQVAGLETEIANKVDASAVEEMVATAIEEIGVIEVVEF